LGKREMMQACCWRGAQIKALFASIVGSLSPPEMSLSSAMPILPIAQLFALQVRPYRR
jgi:hypothetical protein